MTEVLALLNDALRQALVVDGPEGIAKAAWVPIDRVLLARDRLAVALDPGLGTCWFCKGEFVVDALIAGYDTWEESRLACLACNERMQGNWHRHPVAV